MKTNKSYAGRISGIVVGGCMFIGGIILMVSGAVYGNGDWIHEGAALSVSTLISFIGLGFLLARGDPEEDTLEIQERAEGSTSVSDIFGAQIFETKHYCPECGGNIFDVESDGSGCCSACGKVSANIDTIGAITLGRRGQSGGIE